MRKISHDWCQAHGLLINRHLPEIDPIATVKTDAEFSARIAISNLLAAVAYGFPASKALTWAENNRLISAFAASEIEYLRGNNRLIHHSCLFLPGSIWILLWLAGRYDELDLSASVPDDLTHQFPDIKKNEPMATWRIARTKNEIAAKLDLLYCIHWSTVAGGKSDKDIFDLPTVAARRLPLEWLCCSDDWRSISLDT